MPRSFKLGLLKRCLIVFLLSIASNEKGQELWLTKDLCNYVTKNLPIFDSTEMIGDYDEYENQDFVTSFKKVTSVRKIEQKDEKEKLLKLKGFNLAGCPLEWFDEQLKALTQVITKEWNSLFDNYEGFQNELMLVLNKNTHLYQDYEDDVLNLVCDFEDYVDTKCIKVEESNFWQTKFENRVSDKNECLIKYDKLCLKSQVKLSSYIYTFSVIRKSTQLKNWKEKGYIIRNFQKNQNLVYEFGKIGNIKVENCYKFGLIYEVFEYAQKVMDELYFCYYRKPRIKAIDFHYLWDLFERIRNVKHKLVDKVKLLNQAQTSDQKAINVEYLYSIFSQIANGDKKQTAAEKFKEYSELKGTITPQSNKITNSRKGSENLEDDDPFYLEKFTKTEKESQREILNEIILWKTSNIQFEEADQILEDEFLEKQKLIKEKLKLGIRK